MIANMEAMETCLRSFSKFLMLARDCAQNIIASQEQSLYCQNTKPHPHTSIKPVK
uniref:Protein Asterix n=1 Tax=Rhizophora mucronata TaxID=61149 RepID=A0A2P2J7W1_RHIMU